MPQNVFLDNLASLICDPAATGILYAGSQGRNGGAFSGKRGLRDAPYAFEWDFGDGSPYAMEASPNHTYSSEGAYVWTLPVTSGAEPCTQTGTVRAHRIPGDYDGDGVVSIGEVQKAINMFLGLMSPECYADCNADGTISIGEVQKVINAFLDLPAVC